MKVIEIGAALGFDFHGKEDLAAEEIKESKLNCFDSRVIKSLGGSLLTKAVGVEARGLGGGIITLWNEVYFEVKACILNDRCIIMSGVITKLQKSIMFCNVYVANVKKDKLELWKFILNAQVSLLGPWVIEGDFNTVLVPSERKGGAKAAKLFLKARLKEKIPHDKHAKSLEAEMESNFMGKLAQERNGAMVKDLNRTFIALIPKSRCPESLKEYMSISLLGCLYKVLANKLKLMMNSVIGPTQMAFLKGRQMVDSFVNAEDIIHYWKKNEVLARMGFGTKWQEWISWCNGSPSISVLVNVCPTKQFRLERGLCQGDQLSPFLFNLVVKVLSSMFFKAKDLGLIKGVGFGVSAIHITYLQFVDDKVLFIKPSLEYLLNAKRILRCFELASGLKTNFLKSCPIKVGKKIPSNEELANSFHRS
ncbi:hypothetical protein Dsin_009765 [Dipteronia sinensis]|uniref:Reverse transcriptase domain-containing protein n=1 Tax=Dipteronia sinensis TaxID=43782 RepID=A0AAE0ARW8_9ROSI|nr:hypothetical protein Dsin_009765 [Dipteronia sinensis]